MAKLKLPVKFYFDDEIDEIIRELKQLQTYKLFEGAEEVLVDIDEVARVIANHVKATTAEPERKMGEWIVTSEFEDCRYVRCNQCKVAQVFYYNKPLTNFCPNCGAKMKEDKNGRSN